MLLQKKAHVKLRSKKIATDIVDAEIIANNIIIDNLMFCILGMFSNMYKMLFNKFHHHILKY